MKSIELNRTGRGVSAMGIGAMHLSLEGRPSRESAVQVIHEALNRGVTFFDTADAYCIDEGDKHHNEVLLRDALGSYTGNAQNAIIATKGGLIRPEGRWERNGSPEHLRKTIRESYEILGTIHLWQHHAPDSSVPVTDSLQVAREAQEKGLIRWIGVSNYDVDQLEEARKIVDIVSVQNQCSPWHRTSLQNGVLEYCEKHQITFLPWRPLGGRGKAKEMAANPILSTLAKENNASPQQVVLAWLMALSPVVLPIPGVSRKQTLIDSLNAIQVKLTDEDVEHITDHVG